MASEFLDTPLPETSILSEDDYRKMHAVATDSECWTLLTFLARAGRSPRDVFDDEVPDAERCLSRLQDAGLVKHIQSPDGSAFQATSLGEVLVERGPKDGVRMLMRNERRVGDRYGTGDPA